MVEYGWDSYGVRMRVVTNSDLVGFDNLFSSYPFSYFLLPTSYFLPSTSYLDSPLRILHTAVRILLRIFNPPTPGRHAI